MADVAGDEVEVFLDQQVLGLQGLCIIQLVYFYLLDKVDLKRQNEPTQPPGAGQPGL